ncbi:MAG: hypothetical protein HYW89_04710 [Candidatus Sungiibacteriota bacterium]|uniref:RNA 2',3'-cyclic phosphodiesterase n=1 Tax=Candidatus Sungiibacteriota bacterium TaxID=2750080 RepID=A0A7T5RJH3_9BACT|nr:MAG: hypothetical protein HYW89_04710 [Candidatus Sungbacteria bacterium]
MKRRVFIAIPVPENMKKKAGEWQKKHADLKVRWIKPENLHITVIPPWYVDENQLYEVARLLPFTLKGLESFPILFSKVLLGPPGQQSRLLWAEGITPKKFIPPPSQNTPQLAAGMNGRRRNPSRGVQYPAGKVGGFIELKEGFEEALLANPKTGFYKKESRPAKLHLTIARFRPGSIKKLPQPTGVVNWNFKVGEVNLMESRLQKGGAEYAVLESVKFGPDF